MVLMRCREAIFVDESTIDFPIFLLFFNKEFPIFPIFSILSFLFSYFFEQPCRWTPCSSQTFLGLRHAFLPHERLLKQATTSVRDTDASNRNHGPIFISKVKSAVVHLGGTSSGFFPFQMMSNLLVKVAYLSP